MAGAGADRGGSRFARGYANAPHPGHTATQAQLPRMTSPTQFPPRREAVRLKNAKKLSTSSQKWLNRQLNDPYVTAAKAQGWRSRAAFKLIELDDKYHLITKGARVVDLGAAPGGWSQVALARGAADVVGIDLLAIDPVDGAKFILGDFMEPGM